MRLLHMTHSDRTRSDRETGGSPPPGGGRSGRRTALLIVAAILIAAVVAGIAYVALRDEPVEGRLEESEMDDARPAGAGTNPDGEADELNEGLQNETTQEDFIDPEAQTDDEGNPLLDAPGVDAPTEPSIDDLDPGPGVDDEVLERMTPDDPATDDPEAAPEDDPEETEEDPDDL
ncbi:MAG: hypothetical protein ACOCYW_00485 [Roseicyclus sp.]